MGVLSDIERDCLQRYVELLAERLEGRLTAIHLFGSAARGDMWPDASPMHSDIDLLLLTRTAVADEEREALVDLTYPLYLECGRQLSPQFLTEQQVAEPGGARRRRFLEDVARDGVIVWRGA